MQNVKLTELIDIKILQSIQDSFSAYTGMAALTTDADGTPVTEGSGFTELCMNVIRKSPIGVERCAECDRRGAILTFESGRSVVYDCHAGLVDYAAPIMLEGRIIGSFIGGQILVTPSAVERQREIARGLEVDEDVFVEEMKKVHMLSADEVKRAAEFLTNIAETLSELAYSGYCALENSRSLEQAARAQTGYMVDMYSDMEHSIENWIDKANSALASGDKDVLTDVLKELSRTGNELLSSVGNTVEYAKMTGGQLKLKEDNYDLLKLTEEIARMMQSLVETSGNRFFMHLDEKLPQYMFGDFERISRIICKLLGHANQVTEGGEIHMEVSCEQERYAAMLIFVIRNMEKNIRPGHYRSINHYIQLRNSDERIQKDDVNLSVVGVLLGQMHGEIDISCNESGVGTTFVIRIPQLNLRR